MALKKFSASEKAAYKRGKIIGYYNARKKCSKEKASSKPAKARYGDFDPDEAFKRALERTYGSSFNTKKFH